MSAVKEPGPCPFCAWDHPGDPPHAQGCVIGRHVEFARAEGVAAERARLGLDRWPVLIPFIAAMVRKLDANKPKKGGREGWQHDDPIDLIGRIRKKVEELLSDIPLHPDDCSDVPVVLDEAADVANMAMMVADACGVLDERGEHDKEGER